MTLKTLKGERLIKNTYYFYGPQNSIKVVISTVLTNLLRVFSIPREIG